MVYFAITRRTPPPAVSRLVDDQYEPAARVAAGRYSAALLNAVDRALVVQPAARTQSIEDFRAQLGFARRTAQPDSGWSQFADSTGAAANDGPLSIPSLVATRAAPPPIDRRRRGLWAVGLAALTAAAAGGAWLTLKRTPTPAPAPTPTPTITTPSPPAPTVEAPQPAPATALDPFERLLLQRSPGIDVTALPARRQLRIGEDRLSFTVTSSKSGFVHVLLREPDGALLLLFPNAVSARNRIAASKPLKLPQQEWPLVALGPPGVQRLLVVVTQHAHDFSPLKIAQRGDFMQLDGTLRETNPAPDGAALPGRAACDGTACNAYGAAAFEVENVR